MELALTVLPFLVLLVCPLVMLVCVVGMRRMGCSAPPTTEAQTAGQPREARVAALEDQLAAVQSELAVLRIAEGQSPSPQAICSETAAAPEVTRVARRPA